MKKIVFCGNFNFPRGGATANYIENLAKSLQISGYSTEVISNVNKNSLIEESEDFNYEGIKVHPYEMSDNKLKKNFQLQFLQYKYVLQILKSIDLKANDVVITSTSNNFLNRAITRWCKNKEIKTIACVLEWHESKFFKYKSFDFRYWQYLDYFYKANLKFDAIIPISKKINNFYESKGLNTFLMPPLTNTKDISYTKKRNLKKKFIFPANGKMKDDLNTMLKAIKYYKYDNNLEFHFCGVKKIEIEKIIGENFLEEYNNLIVVHDWLDYNDLLELYKTMDFLLLIRRTSKQTLSNFPSKVPEVMTYGVIPVVSNVGDYTNYYLQDNYDSIFIEKNDIDSCIEAIDNALKLSLQEQDKISKNAYNTAVEKFDIYSWSDKLYKFIESL